MFLFGEICRTSDGGELATLPDGALGDQEPGDRAVSSPAERNPTHRKPPHGAPRGNTRRDWAEVLAPSLGLALRASLRLFKIAPGDFVSRGHSRCGSRAKGRTQADKDEPRRTARPC